MKTSHRRTSKLCPPITLPVWDTACLRTGYGEGITHTYIAMIIVVIDEDNLYIVFCKRLCPRLPHIYVWNAKKHLCTPEIINNTTICHMHLHTHLPATLSNTMATENDGTSDIHYLCAPIETIKKRTITIADKTGNTRLAYTCIICMCTARSYVCYSINAINIRKTDIFAIENIIRDMHIKLPTHDAHFCATRRVKIRVDEKIITHFCCFMCFFSRGDFDIDGMFLTLSLLFIYKCKLILSTYKLYHRLRAVGLEFLRLLTLTRKNVFVQSCGKGKNRQVFLFHSSPYIGSEGIALPTSPMLIRFCWWSTLCDKRIDLLCSSNFCSPLSFKLPARLVTSRLVGVSLSVCTEWYLGRLMHLQAIIF